MEQPDGSRNADGPLTNPAGRLTPDTPDTPDPTVPDAPTTRYSLRTPRMFPTNPETLISRVIPIESETPDT